MSDTLSSLDIVKAGETFSFYLDFAIDGVAEDFPATDLASMVRDRNGVKLADLTVAAVAGVPGRFTASAAPATTVKWPEGDHFCDVKRTSGGVVLGSATFIVPVRRFQTR